jgi:hypothetical protein
MCLANLVEKFAAGFKKTEYSILLQLKIAIHRPLVKKKFFYTAFAELPPHEPFSISSFSRLWLVKENEDFSKKICGIGDIVYFRVKAWI